MGDRAPHATGDNRPPPPAPFTLDRVDNPHPRMALRALELRRRYRITPTDPTVVTWWRAYVECMMDATGCTHDQLTAWLDRVEAHQYDPKPQ